MDEKELILGQYKVYNDAKENFINRHFATNRFYFVFAFAILAASFVLYAIAPGIVPLIVAALFGMVVSTLWWLNIDSYQLLIKVKYSKVLEYLETKLPEQPFHREYEETSKMKKASKSFNFTDVQKVFASLLFVVFTVILVSSICSAMNFKNPALL